MKEVIRAAKLKDAQGIATVHVKMWQKNYKGQIPDSFLDNMSIEKRTQNWEKELGEPTVGTHAFVVDIGGVIAGWVTGGINRDSDLPKEVGELYGIYMHPDFAGMGYGSMLMEKLLATLKSDGYKKVTLWVLDTNQKTRDWYESKGWRIEGKTKVDHRDSFDLNETRYIIDL
jgi:ribosomal protein S18 acetylase RimI-like enzyme